MAYYQSYTPYQYQTPYMVQPAQPQQAAQPSINWISGDREAAAYPVAPNNAVALWSQTEPVVYLKQADAAGRPSMKIYDLVERKETQPQAEVKPYATKEDLDRIQEEINTLRAELAKRRPAVKGREEEE